MKASRTETHGIAKINGIFAPYTNQVESIGPRGAQAVVTVYWGVGYDTMDDAQRAISRTEHGLETPPGPYHVSMHTGERVLA